MTGATTTRRRTAGPVVERAKVAVSVAFIFAGLEYASWASRIPQVRDALALDQRSLGAVLLCLAIGSLLSLPLAGVAVERFGAARTVAAAAVLSVAALVGVAALYATQPWLVGLVLVVSGLGAGMWDVAMNVEAAAVEQRLGRSIMPRFHAGFSLGTVAGAGLGALCVATGISVTVHLLVVSAATALVVPRAVRDFLPARAGGTEALGNDVVAGDRGPAVALEPSASATSVDPEPSAGAASSALDAWREPRTLLVGLFVLCMAFSEGTGNDWLALAMIDGYGTAAAVGSLTFAGFLAAMTLGRWFGPGLIDRHGRVPILRASTGLAAVGLVLVTFGGAFPVAVLGSVCWGLGTALGFPVGMSAAADDPARAAARVSVVASIGYVAFLAGPPLIGLLGHAVGTLHSLTLALALMALALLTVQATRPLRP